MENAEDKHPKDMTQAELEDAFVETLTEESPGGLRTDLMKFFLAGVELELEQKGTTIAVDKKKCTVTFTREDGSVNEVDVSDLVE